MGCGASSSSKAQSKSGLGAEPATQDKKKDGGKKSEKRIDEFEELTMRPLPAKSSFEEMFKCGGPTLVSDDVTPCFDNGLLYRIAKDDVWAFYNDTRNYEMHVDFTFGRTSLIRALGNTKVSQVESSGEYLAEAVVYPGETVMYVKGSVAGFKSKIKALPLSEEYIQSRIKLYNKLIEPETERVKKFESSCSTEEEVLDACVQQGVPFIDVNFPPNQSSISSGAERAMKNVPWARPNMYLPETYAPLVRLFRDKISPNNVELGELGDSWLVCAIAVLTEYPEMVRNLFHHPRKPELTAQERAVGAYRVSLNKNGWWTNVIVDDYLPVLAGRPKYARSTHDPCEMWISILEKAYAKVHGSYANIIVGDPLQALQDLSGFPTTRYDESFASDIETGDSELLERLEEYGERGCAIIVVTPVRDPKNEEDDARYKDVGLLMGHVYTIIAIRSFKDEKISLAKIRNPWCRDVEWKGEWGVESSKWNEYPNIAESCDYKSPEPGTFWMSWTEVQKYFNGCGVTFVRPNAMDYRIRGKFTKCIPDVCVLLTVKKKVTIGCTLSQEDRRGTSKTQEDYPPIMLTLSSGRGSLGTMQVEQNTNLDANRPTNQYTFMQSRDVSMLCTLTPECSPYILVPRIMTDDKEVPYVLSLFCDNKIGGDLRAEFHTLPADSQAFANFPSFSGEGQPVTTQFQVRHPNAGFPAEYTNREIAEANFLPKEGGKKGRRESKK